MIYNYQISWFEFMRQITLLAFDADDTLWGSQTYFDSVEQVYCEILASYAEADEISRSLRSTERENNVLYGCGSKSFILSLVENAVYISQGKVTGEEIEQIIEIGKELLRLPGKPFDRVRSSLEQLRATGLYRMVVFTRGELLDQEKKMERSGLRSFFDDVIVVSDKTEDAYRRLCKRFNVRTEQLLMVGNSFSSDIEPVLDVGGWAAYISNYGSWKDEAMVDNVHPRLIRLSRITDLGPWLSSPSMFIDKSRLS